MATPLSVFRWSRGEPSAGRRFAVDAGPDTTVLDALVEIQRAPDPTLAFRYACRVGMCGSCAMVVNGRERWACRTRLETLGAGTGERASALSLPAAARPRRGHGAVRGEAARVGAALVAGRDAEPYALIAGAARAERQEIDPAIECIGCGMCVSACTMVAHNDRFPGPGRAQPSLTLERDSRDAGRGALARAALRRRAGALPRPGQLHRGVSDGAGAHDLDHPPAALATRKLLGLS